MNTIDLTTVRWQVQGWRPDMWMLLQSMETAVPFHPDIPALPAKIPGSVQQALLDAGWLKDWNVGLQSLQAEWAEHRQWEFFTQIPAGAIAPGQRVTLCADGLDYSGWVRVDGKIATEFTGALIRHRLDLTKALGDGKAHQLGIVFDEAPAEQGQLGFTSRSKYFKPRFNYSWDWCPRFVPIGVWDALRLEIGEPTLTVEKLRTQLLEDNRTGVVRFKLKCSTPTAVKIAGVEKTFSAGEHAVELQAKVEPWWPNGHGEQKLYELSVGETKYEVGFKRVRWLPCEGAPKDALPWLCEVNGKPVFLQGVNWTPIRVDYHSITAAEYAHLIKLYREMGCTLLRVWGGAYLEREEFYRLCDRNGLLIWQEFPLSSSGVDNYAPEDPAVIATLCDIARDYISRRGHHVSKLMWCGGNELQCSEQNKKSGGGIPLDLSHPCLAALNRVVEEEDPGTRFVATSSTGPLFYAEEKNFGKGLHHDVHGPWTHEGPFENWERYWAKDDALFRSETGMPGAAPVEIIEKFRDGHDLQPHSHANVYWQHTAGWWIQADLERGKTLTEFVEASQDLQARALSVAAQACKSRFPRCGGFVIWMGHDCFPCAINTAIIDFHGKPKPAYYTLAKVFKSK